jgi:hypothetical protein
MRVFSEGTGYDNFTPTLTFRIEFYQRLSEKSNFEVFRH